MTRQRRGHPSGPQRQTFLPLLLFHLPCPSRQERRQIVDRSDDPLSNHPTTKELRPTDVLIGRGAAVNAYQGNVSYRQLISSRKQAYQTAESKRIKDSLSREILQEIRASNGRFLRRKNRPNEPKEQTTLEGSEWYILPENDAGVVEKVKQALREKKTGTYTLGAEAAGTGETSLDQGNTSHSQATLEYPSAEGSSTTNGPIPYLLLNPQTNVARLPDGTEAAGRMELEHLAQGLSQPTWPTGNGNSAPPNNASFHSTNALHSLLTRILNQDSPVARPLPVTQPQYPCLTSTAALPTDSGRENWLGLLPPTSRHLTVQSSSDLPLVTQFPSTVSTDPELASLIGATPSNGRRLELADLASLRSLIPSHQQLSLDQAQQWMNSVDSSTLEAFLSTSLPLQSPASSLNPTSSDLLSVLVADALRQEVSCTFLQVNAAGRTLPAALTMRSMASNPAFGAFIGDNQAGWASASTNHRTIADPSPTAAPTPAAEEVTHASMGGRGSNASSQGDGPNSYLSLNKRRRTAG